ncbi:prepilin peptidase [Nocardia sp. SYP-A9097]|uniref:prepilin peptidase n=1 Tax=Nocardia sp. SYP-A9097 TaxID=2663237 RepID=UPI00129BF563|nr:A24 family peptidase [Nocardia sp. SYP-A9097]MRH87357.1 prepilin peptidase [Nocardia sp. SYP-A9097]
MESLPLIILTLWCALLSYSDLRTHRLPNLLTLPGAAVVLGYGFATGRGTVAVLGALLLAIPYLLVHLCSPAALGAGDVKLALGLGAATALGGPDAWVSAALTAPVLTVLACVGTLTMDSLSPRHLTVMDGRITNLVPLPRPDTGPVPPVDSTSVQLARVLPIRPVDSASPPPADALRPRRSRRATVPIGAVATGSIGVVAHGPGMCVASVVALLATR